MAKKSLLLVDADPRSLRVLEVSLRKAGYSVATCQDGQAALDTVDLSEPDLILSDTRLPGINGFTLVEELRKREGHQNVPFMFLSSDSSVESKVRGLELGVEDYLTKPIYIKEIITRINLTLQRQEREGLAKRTSISKTRFTGSLGDMGLVDLLQTIDISRKSGVLELTNEAIRGTISFRDGQLVDAELGRLVGEAAIYRLLLWNEGEFEIDFRPVRVEQRVRSSTQAILMEGMRRVDEWGRLLEQIPSLDNVFEVSDEELMDRLAEIPDEINRILKQIDGRRSLIQVVDVCEGDDLETLTAITKLYFEGIVFPTGRTTDGTDTAEDELLVGEHAVPSVDDAESVPPGADGDGSDLDPDAALVPRTPTIAPPRFDDREKTNGDAHADANVSVRADVSVPGPARLPEDQTEALDGMATASTAHVAPEVVPAVVPKPSDVGGERLEAESADDDELSEDIEDSEAPDDEDGMARKGRRRRSKRAKTETQSEVELQEQSLEQESANNVIQFPAQAKRGVASSQVAVNDVHGGSDSVDEAEPDEAHAREDSTQTVVKRDEPVEAESAQAESAQAESAPAESPEEGAAEASAEREPAASAAEPEEAPAAEAQAPEAETAGSEAAVSEAAVSEAAESEAAESEAEAETEASEAKASEAKASEAKAEPAVQPTEEPRGRRKKKKSKKARRESARPPAPADTQAKAEPAQTKPAQTKPAQMDSVPPGPGEIEAVKPAATVEAPRKKVGTTSAEIRAVAMTGEHQAVAEDFFRTTAKPAEVAHETWDDLEHDVLPLPDGMKKAKYATFAIGALGLLLIGGYVVYQNFIMPQPAVLSGATRPPELPTVVDDTDEHPTAAQPEAETPTAAQPEAETPTVGPGEGEEPVAEGEGEAGAEGEEPVAEVAPAEEPVAEVAPAEVAPAEVAPVEVEPVADVNARQLAQQALRALNRRRNDEAAELAGRAVAADQTVALGWLVLGAARQELRDVPGAREAYQNCVEHGQGREVRDCRAMLR